MRTLTGLHAHMRLCTVQECYYLHMATAMANVQASHSAPLPFRQCAGYPVLCSIVKG